MPTVRPTRQRVILAAVSHPKDNHPTEATQLTFGHEDNLDAQQLIDQVRELMKGIPNTYEERQHQTHWGATGLFQQDLVIAYSAGIAAGATIEGIKAVLIGLMHRKDDKRTRASVIRKSASGMEAAWAVLDECLKTVFAVSDPVAISGRTGTSGWEFEVEDGGQRYWGLVTDDLRIVDVRRVGR